MDEFAAQTWLPLMGEACLKSLPLFAFALLGVCLFRRFSASHRHLIWLLALGSLPCLPLLSRLLPHWSVSVPSYSLTALSARTHLPASARISLETDPLHAPSLSKPSDIPGAATSPPPAASPIAVQSLWPRTLFLLWLTGLAAVLRQLLAGIHAVKRMERRYPEIPDGSLADLAARLAAEVGLKRPACLRQPQSEQEGVVPMTWGYRRPSLLLPAHADTWPEERLRVVLLHELAHIRRGDWLLHRLAHLICGLFWFHPLVWIAARQLHSESERACDDYVLGTRVPPSDYASHLLEVIHAMQNNRTTENPVVALTGTAQIEARIRAILNSRLDRRTLTRPRQFLLLLLAASLLLPLAALKIAAHAQNAAHRTAGSDKASKPTLDTHNMQMGCMRRQKFLALMWDMYAQDWDDRMPPMKTFAQFKRALRPYSTFFNGKIDDSLFICPETQLPYEINPTVGGKNIHSIKDTVVVSQDAQPHTTSLADKRPRHYWLGVNIHGRTLAKWDGRDYRG